MSFSSTNEIFGQFLPRIYTRRITLEDAQFKSNSNVIAPMTKVTVDYHIKDILNENGVGVITRTRDGLPESEEETMQGRILRALEVGLVLLGSKTAAQSMATRLINNQNTQKSVKHQVNETIMGLRSQGFEVQNPIYRLGRPETIGFEFRNTIYQEYDLDNNIINIIPSKQSFTIDSELPDISLVCFTFFNFESLELPGLTSYEIDSLSNTLGDLTVDSIIENNNVVSTGRVYTVVGTNQPYAGPVHYHSAQNPGPDGYIGYMAGYAGADMGAKLNQILVPLTKIQDFRGMERLKNVFYQPPQLEFFNNKQLDISFLDKRYKNFFKFGEEGDNVNIERDGEVGTVAIRFDINLLDIYKFNSRYYDFAQSIPPIIDNPKSFLRINNIKILRRKMTDYPIGNDRFGFPDHKPYLPESLGNHIVVRSSDRPNTLPTRIQNIASGQDGFLFEEQFNVSRAIRRFQAMDISVANGPRATYQYGVEITFLDETRNFLATKLDRARSLLSRLERYSQEAKIPVFDSINVTNRGNDALPIGLSEPPEYATSIRKGNYDARNDKFTSEFISSARQKYGNGSRNAFLPYVLNFIEIVYYSFGKTSVNMTRSEVNTVQSDDYLYKDYSDNPLGVLGYMQDDGYLNTPQALQGELINLLDPGNARPETIDSFIKSYRDLISEMEDFFDIDYVNNINMDGGGYNAKGDITFTVQRWFKYPRTDRRF